MAAVRHNGSMTAGWLTIFPKVGQDGDSALTSGLVFCPFQGADLEVEECKTCEYCDGVAIDPTGRNSFLICNRALVDTADEYQPKYGFQRETPPEAGPRLTKTPIRDIMTNLVVTVSPEMTLTDLARLFLERGISGAPVVGSGRKVLGVVSKTDVLRAVDENEGFACGTPDVAQLRVGDIMTPITFSMPEHATLGRAAALMAYEGVHRLPVLDEHDHVIGLLSAIDVMRWIAREDGYQVPGYTQQQRDQSDSGRT